MQQIFLFTTLPQYECNISNCI